MQAIRISGQSWLERQIVNEFADGKRENKLQQSGNNGARKIQNKQSLIGPIVRKTF